MLPINDSTPQFIQVRWKSRTVAFVDTSVQSIVEKACTYFRLEAIKEDLVLRGEIKGVEVELSDDTLKLLPEMTTATLVQIACQYNADALTAGFGGLSVSRHLCQAYTYPAWYSEDWDSSSHSEDDSQLMQIFCKIRTGKTLTLSVRPTDSIKRVKQLIQDREGILPDERHVVSAGRLLEDDLSLAFHNIGEGSTIQLVPKLLGKKPVIYLFPQETLPDATVSVRLVPEWSFTHIYPLSQPKTLKDGKQEVLWLVSARPDGSLVDKPTGVELSYLYWEAASNPPIPPSPPSSPRPTPTPTHHNPTLTEHFDPSLPSLTADSPTAVLLPFAQLLPYLDSALKSLTLHTAARNDFITYWLPALAKQPFVALRFLPQAAYERAAELEVAPAPDVVTRVFMLFRGVGADEAGMWSAARERVGSVDWPGVVVVKPEALDTGLFRVLEWGAMEVLA